MGVPVTVVETSPKPLPRLSVAALTVLAAVLFAFGWVAGKVSLPVGWLWAAVRVGWLDARGEEIRS